jgi:hypothetical protein
MKLGCDQCGKLLTPEEVNIQTDVAKCQQCGKVSKVSELAAYLDYNNIDYTPPIKGRIKLSRDRTSDITLEIPPKGLDAGVIFLAIFATVWLSFVGFWTYMAVFNIPETIIGLAFAAFSIPFWYAGLKMIQGLLLSLTGREKLIFDTRELILVKKSLLGSKQVGIPYEEIDKIRLERNWIAKSSGLSAETFSNLNAHQRTNAGYKDLILYESKHPIPLFQNATIPEKQWLYQLIRGVVFQKKNTMVF